MAGTLKIVNNFLLDSLGNEITGKQGLAVSLMSDTFDISVTGPIHHVQGQLATATVVTVYDDDDDVPIDWVYLHYVADQISYIQIVGPTMQVTFKIAAYEPFVLPGFDSLLASAASTIITGGAEPAVVDIDSIVLGNYSGTTMNYSFAVIL